MIGRLLAAEFLVLTLTRCAFSLATAAAQSAQTKLAKQFDLRHLLVLTVANPLACFFSGVTTAYCFLGALAGQPGGAVYGWLIAALGGPFALSIWIRYALNRCRKDNRDAWIDTSEVTKQWLASRMVRWRISHGVLTFSGFLNAGTMLVGAVWRQATGLSWTAAVMGVLATGFLHNCLKFWINALDPPGLAISAIIHGVGFQGNPERYHPIQDSSLRFHPMGRIRKDLALGLTLWLWEIARSVPGNQRGELLGKRHALVTCADQGILTGAQSDLGQIISMLSAANADGTMLDRGLGEIRPVRPWPVQLAWWAGVALLAVITAAAAFAVVSSWHDVPLSR